MHKDNPFIRIRSYSSQDSSYAVANLFHQSIHAIDDAMYSQVQKAAWAPNPPDYDMWQTHLKPEKTLLAFKGDALIGFIELDINLLDRTGMIDCFYVASQYQGSGVGHQLYSALLARAKEHRLDWLYVEASKVAKPFFLARGFSLLKENTVHRRGEALVNYSMHMAINTK